MRSDNRNYDQLRPVTIEPEYLKYPPGSVLISFGNTRVICSVTVEERIPAFLESRSEPQGWLTAEYSLLPASGLSRNPRAGYGNNHVKGRVYEIQRLIGRSIRSVIDMKKLGPRTLLIDCDVIQADGGTRTASVTGSMVALEIAIKKLMSDGRLKENPITGRIAAVSVGIVSGAVYLDLDYNEDSAAETDLNLVMNRSGEYIELQSTAEKGTFSRAQLELMMKYAETGIRELFAVQDKVLGNK